MIRTQGAGSQVSRLRRLATTAVIAVAATALAGCSALGGSDSTDAGGNDKVEKATIKVAVIPKLIDIAGYERALRSGYFEKEGLKIEEVSIKSATEAIPLFKNNQIDFAFGNWTSFVEAQAKGVVDLKAIADAQQAAEGMTALVAMPDSGIKTVKDLAGKSIGVNALKSNVTLTSQAVMQANDVDPNSVRFTVIPTASAINALETKQIDVMSLQEPNLTSAKQKIGVVVVADRATGPVSNFPISGYVASSSFAKDNPKTVQAFQRAMAKGQSDVSERQTFETTLLQYSDIDKDTAKMVVAGTWPTSVDKTRLQRVADLMQTYGILDQKVDISSMIQPPPAS